jgi:hypothetical protein
MMKKMIYGVSISFLFVLAVNAQDQNKKLMEAIYNCDARAVAKALDKGADPNLSEWFLPLGVAADLCKIEVVNILLKRGANVNAVGRSGDTALFFALDSKDENIITTLLEKGASVNVRNKEGTTPLMRAVTAHFHVIQDANAGKANTVRLLLEKGADVTLKNKVGDSALDLAGCHPNIVAMLKTAGAREETGVAITQIGKGESITLNSGVKVTVKNTPAERWLKTYRSKFSDVKGALFAIVMEFSGGTANLSFMQRPNLEQSDLTLIVGQQRITPHTMAIPNNRREGLDLFAELEPAKGCRMLYFSSHNEKSPLTMLFEIPKDLVNEKKWLSLRLRNETPVVVDIN